MEYVIIFWLFAVYAMNIQATTHWMVTESGLIQPKLESQYEMANPHDLLAFLNQDFHWENFKELSDSMASKQVIINKYWSDLIRDTNTAALLALSENCVKAGSLNALDWYFSHFEDGTRRNIGEHEFMLYTSNGEDSDVPDCKKISSLVFRLGDLDELEGVKHVDKLTKPELTLPRQISPIMAVNEFGHWVATTLRKNTTSWLHFTMASWYWRVKGNAAKAVDCSRRAVYFAPKHYKDIALLSMGSTLHRSSKTEDAVKVLKAAVDHEPNYHINHFALASAYAVLGDFNSSVRYFDRCLKVNPGFDLAIRYRYGALCHAFLLRKMKLAKKTLDKLRPELREFAKIESTWLKTQAAFLKKMKHTDGFDPMNIENNCVKMAEITGIDIKKLKKEADKNSLIHYYLNGHLFDDGWFETKGVASLESLYSLQRLIKHVDKHAAVASLFVVHSEQLTTHIIKEPGAFVPGVFKDDIKAKKVPITNSDKTEKSTSSPNKSSSQPEEDLVNLEIGPPLYPLSMNISRLREEFDRDLEWPPMKLCEENPPNTTDNIDAVYATFLPFENKGIRLKYLLTDKIKVPADVEHELPWHPPTCPRDRYAAAYAPKKQHKHQQVREVVTTDYLRQKLLEYVHNGDTELVQHMQDAEIGQRIYTAMKMNLVPKWLIYTLSSLYWRVRRNNLNALNCLLVASRTVKKRFKDIVLVSLASVFLEMGYFDESLAAAEECFVINLYEPATNFILAELNMIGNHGGTQLFHLKQTLRVDPGFMGGLARRLLLGWACILKQARALDKKDKEDNVCSQVESGVNLVCEKDGISCHVAAVQCHSKESGTGAGKYAERLLSDRSQLKGKPLGFTAASAYQKVINIMDAVPLSAEIDDSIFNAFKEKMPASSADRPAHYENYHLMMRSINRKLKGCGPRSCSDIHPDELSIKLEDCNLQHLQLNFWLHTVTSAHLQSDPNLRLPPEVLTVTPSNRKIPACQLTVDPSKDFYLERMSGVDTEGWEPLIRPMQQFAELYNFYDYIILGAKYAKYVESNPRSWLGSLGAGWWCGAGGRGACAVRCLAAAYWLAPREHAQHAVRALTALLYLQNKDQDAKEMAYLSFYRVPNKIEAFLIALTHTYLEEYDEAVWFYRYALKFDEKFTQARACLHAAMCIMIFRERAVNDHNEAKIAT